MKKYSVTFLFDKENDWLSQFFLTNNEFTNSQKFQFSFVFNPELIENQDVVFILGYTKKLNNEFLRRNSINLVIHESALPKGKGFSPMQWQILEGKNKIPVCLFQAVDKIDSGDIYSESFIDLCGDELYEEWRAKQAKATVEIVKNFLDNYPVFTKRKQEGEETFYRKRDKNDGELDLDKTLRQQFDLLRIGNNEKWPSYFILNKRKFLIKIYTEDE